MGSSVNVTGVSCETLDEVRVTSRSDVIAQIHLARRCGITLYPLSTGYNWGYGSRSPVLTGSRILDLSGMNHIVNAKEISEGNPVAVIEPGVTQGQLADFLRDCHPNLTFNVTGAGRDTSIIGNALDRGVGYYGPRREDIFGLEIVTGTGEVLKTGFRRLGEHSPIAHCHPYGLGPILDGLFFQGNFGIVTSACLQLLPRRPVEVAVSIALKQPEKLWVLINELARMKAEGLLPSVTHIGNKARTHSTLSYGVTRYLEEHAGLRPIQAAREAERVLAQIAPHEWSGLASVTGNRGQVRAALSEIRRRISPFATLRVVTEGRLRLGYTIANALRFIPFARANAATIAAIKPLHGLALGVPTNVAIENLLWKFGEPDRPANELDESRCGLLFVNPALPLDGKFVVDVINEMKSVAAKYSHTLYITLNIETATSMVAVINLLFDRSIKSEIERAHHCADELLKVIWARDLSPYRARVDMMNEIVSRDPDYWKWIRSIKLTFDPENIIAPGRYNLP